MSTIDDAVNATKDAARNLGHRASTLLGLDEEGEAEGSNADRLKEVLAAFDTAVLVTNVNDVPAGRPMSVADFDGHDLWFVTGNQSPKAMEIANDGYALVTLQSQTAFAFVRGEAELVHDIERTKELWSSAMSLWWPDGPESDGLTLIRFTPTSGQYWDMRGTRGLRFVGHVAEAVLTGDAIRPVPGTDGHAVL